MWICAQIGAREHFAVPRALHNAGRLSALYTDYWAGSAMRQIATGPVPDAARSLALRFHPELDTAKVHSWNVRSLYWDARRRLISRQGEAGRYQGYIEYGRLFACAVRDSLRRRSDLSPASVFFAYDTGALETMEWLRERGIACVLNQMDPAGVEMNLVREEEMAWPGWQGRTAEVPEEYCQRREREWALADCVVVNSEFSRQALIEQGVPTEKLSVIPLCYERISTEPLSDTRPKNAGLRVLWLGQVILRKGIQYLLEAARLLIGENVRFDVVGPIGISPDAIASAPSNVTFHGRVSRDQIGTWYRQADVFVLPTISDGFALTQLEAMAHGLPVIATPNCGKVVSHGTDGWILPIRDPQALASAIQCYLTEADLLQAHRAAAFDKVRQFSLAHLTNNLSDLEKQLRGTADSADSRLLHCHV